MLGTAKLHPNHGGPAPHVANASFMVDPDHAGRGVGRALGEAAIARARREGYRAMQFNAVVETNARAVALWRSLGFAILATVPEGFRHPRHGFVGLHVMHRSLLDAPAGAGAGVHVRQDEGARAGARRRVLTRRASARPSAA